MSSIDHKRLFFSGAGLALLCALPLVSGAQPSKPTNANRPVAKATALVPTLSPKLPDDIPGGAPNASLEQAANFAWQEFIAINWPASSKRRETPTAGAFDAKADVRVWETMRGRVEAYPGTSQPITARGTDYGYDAPPRYLYDPLKVGRHPGLEDGEIPPCDGSVQGHTPWHNLDEIDHNNVRAGLSPKGPYPGQQILLESKVNRTHFVYVASRGWTGQTSLRQSARRTGEYVRTELHAPPPAKRADDPADTRYVSFPVHAMEVKAAWRRLGPLDDPTHFYSSRVRYYANPKTGYCFADSGDASNAQDRWGLLALHIMYKTASAPYFVWATFEQVDNLVADQLDATGHPVHIELPDGSLSPAGAAVSDAYTPNIRLVPASATVAQRFVPETMRPPLTPHNQLYYHQEAAYDIPEAKYIGINRRINPTPETIVEVNRAWQSLIQQRAPDSPFRHYRLVSVQWVPMTKDPGGGFKGPGEPSIYYASNVIIEGAPVAQAFSGQFSHGTSKFSDYVHRELVFLNPKPNPGGAVFLNTFFAGKGFLAGGCMGCHGTRQAYGSDWSFLLDRQQVREPEVKDLK